MTSISSKYKIEARYWQNLVSQKVAIIYLIRCWRCFCSVSITTCWLRESNRLVQNYILLLALKLGLSETELHCSGQQKALILINKVEFLNLFISKSTRFSMVRALGPGQVPTPFYSIELNSKRFIKLRQFRPSWSSLSISTIHLLS